MLETVDFSQEPLPKEEYKTRHDKLVEELVVLQQEAKRRGIGLVVLFEGWNGAGKGSRISDLMYNLDARATSVYVTENLNVEAERSFSGRKNGVTGFFPVMQEFWRALGERGTITFYDRGWYTAAVQHMLYTEFGKIGLPDKDGKKGKGKRSGQEKAARRRAERARTALAARMSGKAAAAATDDDPLERYLESAADFERQLVDDGYLVVKFFIHVTKQGQRARLTRLHDDPATSWRVSEDKLARIGNYDEAHAFYDCLLEGSNFSFAPWSVLNGEDKRRTNLAIAETLVDAIRSRLEAEPDPQAAAAAAKAQANSAGQEAEGDGEAAADATEGADAPDAVAVAAQRAADEARRLAPRNSQFVTFADYPRLDKVDHTLALERDEYRSRLKEQQQRLNELEMEMYQKRVPLIIMYEGWDAAGKGGNIKRVAQALDARAYTIFPSPAPTKPELMHPHLWRYWTRLPKAGHVGIYDRSWYGRVLVERVEGFASPEQWGRAYDEINEFERELVRWGALLLKFWVDVSPEEQLRRFQERQDDPAKQWKITEEDWRNRDKYPQYKAAVEDMFRLTSTSFAPWTLLESDNKYYARIKALETINRALEARLHES